MRLDKMLNVESCKRIYRYVPTELQFAILNDIEVMREVLIKIWKNNKNI